MAAFNPSGTARVLLVDETGSPYVLAGTRASGSFNPSGTARVLLVDENGVPYKATGGGGENPAGANGDIQYNNVGSFGGIAGMTITLTIPGLAILTFTKGILTAAVRP